MHHGYYVKWNMPILNTIISIISGNHRHRLLALDLTVPFRVVPNLLLSCLFSKPHCFLDCWLSSVKSISCALMFAWSYVQACSFHRALYPMELSLTFPAPVPLLLVSGSSESQVLISEKQWWSKWSVQTACFSDFSLSGNRKLRGWSLLGEASPIFREVLYS